MILKNAKLYNPDNTFKTGDLIMEKGLIAESAESGSQSFDANGLYAIPGLTDIHLHGAMSHDFCDATPEALSAISLYQAQNGVTGFTPASMTFSEEILTDIFANAKTKTPPKGAMLMGINMEGPFLAEKKKGAQNPRYLEKPDIDMFKRLNALTDGAIKLITLAPETPGADAFIEALKDETVISLGHTTADYDIAAKAFDLGAKNVTHLFNAMAPFTHREPGLVGAAFDHPQVTVELISDGVHIHPSMVRTAFTLFAGRLALISDSMCATGLSDGNYTLGGQAVTVKGTHATLEGGTLAGSVTNLMDCMRNTVALGIPLETAIQAAAVTPAKIIGEYHRTGSLEVGKLANVVLLDKDLNIVQVFVKGVAVI